MKFFLLILLPQIAGYGAVAWWVFSNSGGRKSDLTPNEEVNKQRSALDKKITSNRQVLTSFLHVITSILRSLTSFFRVITSFLRSLTSFFREITSFLRRLTSFFRVI